MIGTHNKVLTNKGCIIEISNEDRRDIKKALGIQRAWNWVERAKGGHYITEKRALRSML